MQMDTEGLPGGYGDAKRAGKWHWPQRAQRQCIRLIGAQARNRDIPLKRQWRLRHATQGILEWRHMCARRCGWTTFGHLFVLLGKRNKDGQARNLGAVSVT